MGEVSVIIVSWNARAHLRNCLASLKETSLNELREIIVVDNASADGSPEMVAEEFPEVTLLRSPENLGFAKANNLGLRHATGSLLALINSDVIVHEGCFQTLTRFLREHPDVGLVGPKVYGGDGNLQCTRGRLPTIWNTLCDFLLLDQIFPRWRLFSSFIMRPEELDGEGEAEVLSGCFWLTRRAVVAKVGGLDERFFFYAEDIDWCKRLRDAGWKLTFVPEATAVHFGSGSTSNARLRFNVEILRANLAYFRKHHGLLGRWAYFALAMVQHTLRLVVRGGMRVLGLAKGDETRQKLQEHFVCLRWLLTGKGI